MATIIPALISAFATLLVCLVNNHYQRIEADRKHSETIALIEYKLDDLSKKVEKHNQLVERTYELEKRADVAEEKLRVANHRIDDLEKVA